MSESADEASEIIFFDPAELTPAQRAGVACVLCEKVWPRPSVEVGSFPDLSPVLSCPECATALSRPAAEVAPAPVAHKSRRARRWHLRFRPVGH